MKQLVVLSGKGGTGKTTVTAALAHLISRDAGLVLVDADVDAPNLGLILHPRILEETPFHGGVRAVIDDESCVGCGRCAEVCRFDAVRESDGVYAVDEIACEGCASCYFQCPAEAIKMADCLSGTWFRSETRFGAFVHARLRAGEENSGLLVSKIRHEARLAADHGAGSDWILIDGAPGIGCPVIAAVTGTDAALLVAEPTLSGIHDMRRALDVTEHFGVKPYVCVNKTDINPGLADEIESFCVAEGIDVVARLPYDEVVLEAMAQGLTVTEVPDNGVGRGIEALWTTLGDRL